MDHWYEIWETETGNLAGDYGSEAEALDVVRRIMLSDQPQIVSTLLLSEEFSSGESRMIAAGEALAQLAESREPLAR